MTMDKLRQMIVDCPGAKTILLTPRDAQSINLPTWTKRLFGLKVVLVANFPESKVVPHFYETVHVNSAKREERFNEISKEMMDANRDSK